MNELETNKLIDRLVDGELDSAQRRELLLRLESEPGAWRHCALAFLESQSWRAAMGTIPVDSSVAIATPTVAPWRLVSRTALAASLLVAFAVGWTSGIRFGRPQAEAALATAHQPTTVDRSEPSPRIRALPHDPSTSTSASPGQPVDGPEGPQRAETTILSGPRIMRPSSLPGYIRGQIERTGYRVEERPGLLAVDFQNGRRLAIPVAEIRFRFIGGRSY